jgi:hypothetical protein
MTNTISYSLKNNDDDNGTSTLYISRTNNKEKAREQEMCMVLSEYNLMIFCWQTNLIMSKKKVFILKFVSQNNFFFLYWQNVSTNT